MIYTINRLAKLSGVSTRTLRYYDEIGLLKPERNPDNGYRTYAEHQIDLLQQILFYRELGFSLDEIKKILNAPDFDRQQALKDHLTALQYKKEQIETLIGTVTKTLCSLKGETAMEDQEKFEGFKQGLLDENERKYGAEIRAKYGNDAVDASNDKFKSMEEEQWKNAENTRRQINELLKAALKEGDPCGEAAQKACALHQEWLCQFWRSGTYSKEAHRSLGEMYAADERFKAYYEENAGLGAAEFFRDAIREYCR